MRMKDLHAPAHLKEKAMCDKAHLQTFLKVKILICANKVYTINFKMKKDKLKPLGMGKIMNNINLDKDCPFVED